MLGFDIRKAWETQRTKFAVLVLWLIVVFVVPLISMIPAVSGMISAAPVAFVAPEDDAVFKHFISLMQNGKYDTAYAMLSKDSQASIPKDQWSSMFQFLKNTGDDARLVGASFNTTKVGKVISWGGSGTSSGEGMPKSTTVYEVNYEVSNNDPSDPTYTYALISMGGVKRDGKLEVEGFHVNLRPFSVKDQPAIDFKSNLLWMILAILMPLFIAYTAFNYLTTAANPRWLLFIVILLLNLYLYMVGDTINAKFGFYSFFSQTPYGVATFIAPAPLGAIYYWITRKKYLKVGASQ